MFRRVAPVLVTLACLSTGAQAQPASLFRAYLSATGSDANPCTLAAPCRLLPAALNAVASGGEIWMLDSANYNTGTVTIGKSVSILSVPGAQGSIVLNNGHAIVVSASGLSVALRNVAVVPVVGAGTAGQFGLHLIGNSTVTLDRCLFAGLPDDAIRMTEGRLLLTDSMVRDSKDGWAVNVTSNSGAYASISHSRLLSNAEGGVRFSSAGGETQGTVSDSVIVGRAGGTSRGIHAVTSALYAVAVVGVTRTKIEATAEAISTSTGQQLGYAEVTVGGSMLVSNGVGFQNTAGGSIYSLRDNILYRNGLNNGGPIQTMSPL